MSIQYTGISSLRSALKSGVFSAVEVAQDAIARVKNAQYLNAFLHVDPKLTLDQARQADAALRSGSEKSLTGIPIAHKDIFVTCGWRTTAGSKMLADYMSPFNATVVTRLLDSGAITIGKLNCDEFGMGSANVSSAYGPVKNPWDTDATPGGSSGGSAAATAARIVAAATGTDTGGSIRQPASLCCVSGIKPTYGTVSRYGIIAYGSSLDQAGILAPCCLDLLELLDVISGFDAKDSTCLEYCNGVPNQPGRVYTDFKKAHSLYNSSFPPLKNLRIGIPKEFFGPTLGSDVGATIETALTKFGSLGAKLVPISLPLTELTVPIYYIIALAEASSNLARYDGIRYGHCTKRFGNLKEMVSRSRAEGFGKEVQRRILMGTYVLSHGYYDAYYLKAQRLRKAIIQDFQCVLNGQCDVIMGPVTPKVAKDIRECYNDAPIDDWISDIYTLGPSLAGLPAMSIPCGFSHGVNKRRPIGLQVIGNYFEEGRLLALAEQYQRTTDWHRYVPETRGT